MTHEKNGSGKIALSIILAVLGVVLNLIAGFAFNTVVKTREDVNSLKQEVAQLRNDLATINSRADEAHKNRWDIQRMERYAIETERMNQAFKSPDVRNIIRD